MTMEEDAEERQQEQEALAAIYGDDFEALGEDAWRLRFVSRQAEHLVAVMTVYLPADYPSSSAPLAELQADWLRTDAVDEIAAELLSLFEPGEIAVFNMMEHLQENIGQHALPERLNPQEEDTAVEAAADEEVMGAAFEHVEAATVAPRGIEEDCPAITSGETFVDRKSVFQAHTATITSSAEADAVVRRLYTNSKVAKATHNVVAYRVRDQTKGGSLVQDCDDDGETAAGGRVLHMLELTGCIDVIVVISRWYGGVHLGPDRFRHFNNVARKLLVAQGYIAEEEGGKDSKKKHSKSSKR